MALPCRIRSRGAAVAFLLPCLLLFSMFISGCATPVVVVQRLDDGAFAKWVSQVNTDTQQISQQLTEQAPNLSLNDRLGQLFIALNDTLTDSPGEASLVWRRWRETSGNLTTLADYFLTRSLLLNYYFDTLGGDLLIPLEADRYGLTLADKALDRLFGDSAEYVAPWVLSDLAFATGTSYGPTPIVNRARTDALHGMLEQSLGAQNNPGSNLSPAAVMQAVAANEVAHATLLNRYRFGVDSDDRFEILRLELPGLKLRTARQAHEFISDAASLATHSAAIYGMTTSLLGSLTLTDAGEMRVSGSEPYAPGAAFFANSVTTVLNRMGRPPLFDEALERYENAGPETRDAIALGLSTELIASLGRTGYRDLVDDYVRYAAAIIEQLEKTQPSNE